MVVATYAAILWLLEVGDLKLAMSSAVVRYEDEEHPGVCQAMEQAARSFMFDCDANKLEGDAEEQQQCKVEEIDV